MSQSNGGTLSSEDIQKTFNNAPEYGSIYAIRTYETSQSDGITRIPYITDQNNPAVKAYVEAVELGLHSLPHDQLLKALYWVYDFMDRGSINFVVVGKTAEAVISKKDLTGDKITVAVRKLEWESGGKRTVDSFAPPIKEDDKTAEYEYEGVPVLVYILDDDYTISSPNQEIYKSEFFKFPNPYKEFKEKYPWVI